MSGVAGNLRKHSYEGKRCGHLRPAFSSELVQIIRVAEWCIVPQFLVVEPLTLKSGMAAPRSPVNNCGLVKSFSGSSQLSICAIENAQVKERQLIQPLRSYV